VEGDLEGEGEGEGERVVKRGEEIKGQEVKGVMEQRDALVFRTNYLFLEVSVGIVVIAVGMTGMTFAGFWKMGRRVTLSPVETARAMRDGEVFRGLGSNEEIEGLLRAGGELWSGLGELGGRGERG